MKYYVDAYLHELVKEKDVFAPPERYYEYRKGIDEIIIETYIASYNPLKLIDFAHGAGEDQYLLSIQRKNFLEEHGMSRGAQLYAYTVPPSWFEDAILKFAKMEDVE